MSPKIISSRLHIRWWASCLVTALLMSIVLPGYAQSFPRISERAESITQPVRASGDVSPLKPRRVGSSPTPVLISIDTVSQAKRSAQAATVSPPGTPYQIGFGRDVPQLGSTGDTSAHLQWRNTLEAGKIAAISITSPQAVGIRLGILVRRLPAEAILRFYAQDSDIIRITGRSML